jgi:hypothetical protein
MLLEIKLFIESLLLSKTKYLTKIICFYHRNRNDAFFMATTALLRIQNLRLRLDLFHIQLIHQYHHNSQQGHCQYNTQDARQRAH